MFRLNLPRLWLSAVTFIGAITAMLISFQLDLPRPWWVLMVAYVTTQPLGGTMRPKMTYRLVGVLVGAAAAVVLVPHLVNKPAALTLALAAWIGVCLYFAALERTPRAFGFMMAGYTAAIIGFPYLDQPGDIFRIALDRVEEMALAIVCTIVAHSVLRPWSPLSTVRDRIGAFLADGRLWFADAFRGIHGFRQDNDRRRFASDLAELSIVAIHLPPEAFSAAVSRRLVGALQDEMSVLLPLASAVEDRIDALRARAALPAEVAALIEEVVAWLSDAHDAAPESARELRARCLALAPNLEPRADWDALLTASLCQRLAEFVSAYANSCELAGQLKDRPPAASSRVRRLLARESRRPLHRHYPVAILSGAATAAALVAYCTVWIITGWPQGGATAAFAAMIACSYTAQDDPAPGIVKYLGFTIAAYPIAALYLFVLLPVVDGAIPLAIALIPPLLFMGYMQADPKTAPYALAMLAAFIVAMGFLQRFTADYALFFNVAFAQMGGVIATIGTARLFRSVGADWSVRRILRQGWREIAALAVASRAADEITWSHRMHDRVGQIASRMAMLAPGEPFREADPLRDLRVGRNVIRLRRAQINAPEMAAGPVRSLLIQLAAFYDARGRRGGAMKPPPALLASIDEALANLHTVPPGDSRWHGFLALAGLRRNLFPEAAAYEGAQA